MNSSTSLPATKQPPPRVQPRPAPDWAEITQRILNGDRSAEGELYTAFSRGARITIARQLGPEHLEDNIHDCFVMSLEAVRKGQVREPQRLMGFVRTIIARRIGDVIGDRVKNRVRLCSVDPSVVDILNREQQNPEDQLIAQQRRVLAKEAVARLSARDREILSRFYLQEQTKEQICREMNLTATQFRLIKSRTMARLTIRTEPLRALPGGGVRRLRNVLEA